MTISLLTDTKRSILNTKGRKDHPTYNKTKVG